MAISPINLGNFFTNSSGATVSSGLSSGLNTDSIIKSLTAAQEAQVTGLEDQIDINNDRVSALTTLKQYLSNLQNALTPLSNPNNVDPTNNLFAVRSTSITSNTTQAASNYLTTSVASGTASGVYSITEISQLATYTVQETNAFTLASATDSVVPSTPAAGFFRAGTVVVRGQNVTISEGDSLADIAQSFNAVSGSTDISASVLQTAPGVYKLIFTSTDTGVDFRFNFGDSGTMSSDPSGVFTDITMSVPVDGEDASFKLNGVSITRPTNNIDDLIDGVTFNLLQDTVSQPGASFIIKIEPDVENIALGVSNFATAYNNFLYFFSQQTERNSDGTFKDTAVLNNDTTLRTIFNAVSSVASSVVRGLADGELNSFNSVGITFTDYAGDSEVPATGNILSVDTSTLKSKLLTDFEGVAKVFGDGFSTSNTNLLLYKAPTDAQGITDFTLNINQTTETYTATYTDAQSVVQTVNFTGTSLSTGGVSLVADEDSIFAGLTLIWASSGNASGINVTVTQGLLSRMDKMVEDAIAASDGQIVNAQNAIIEENETIEDEVDRINLQMNLQRDTLLARYAALEAAIAQANSVLNLLNAQQLASQT